MTALAKALVAAQKDMPAIKPDSTNPHFKSPFVSLGHLLAVVLKVLNKHGIALAQFPSRFDDGQPSLTTLLIHDSGEQMSYEAPLFLSKMDPQGHGSALTYARRYGIAAALGISDEKDDDAEAATNREAVDPRDVKIPGGKYAGQTIGEVFAVDRAYIEKISMESKAQAVKDAATQVILDAELPFA